MYNSFNCLWASEYRENVPENVNNPRSGYGTFFACKITMFKVSARTAEMSARVPVGLHATSPFSGLQSNVQPARFFDFGCCIAYDR
jgi:hypothetical protein